MFEIIHMSISSKRSSTNLQVKLLLSVDELYIPGIFLMTGLIGAVAGWLDITGGID